MDATSAKPALNAVSRLILASTAAIGLAAAILAAPTNVAALGRAPAKSPAAMSPLSMAPGLVLTRAYGADDEDCVTVSTGDGSSRSAIVCGH